MGLRPGFERPVTEEEIHDLIEEGEKSGAIHAAERDMIEGVLDLADRAIRTIMTPRPDVLWIDLDDAKDATLRKLRECHHAQLLVSRDRMDEIAGVVSKQDLLDQYLGNGSLDLESAIHKPLIVHEGASILRTLDLFRKTPVHSAVIVDEYGSIQGIVTRTDLLEAVAGDLPNINAESEPKVVRRDDGAFLIDATIPISEVADLLGSARPAAWRLSYPCRICALAASARGTGGRAVHLGAMELSDRRDGWPPDRESSGATRSRSSGKSGLKRDSVSLSVSNCSSGGNLSLK